MTSSSNRLALRLDLLFEKQEARLLYFFFLISSPVGRCCRRNILIRNFLDQACVDTIIFPMMTTKLIRRTVSVSEDPYGSDSGSSKEEEKTIPFLRRLVDMLKENEDVISFHPGSVKEGTAITLGRIVVHDRVKVEASILPRYFNHSSFASLRRQLNYFCFIRMGKGRQRGATYCNDAVIVMDDILRLKRRSTPVGAATAAPTTTTPSTGKRDRSISELLPTPFYDEQEDQTTQQPAKKSRPTIISPRSSPVLLGMEEDEDQQPQGRRISLDLTTLPANAHHELLQPCLLREYTTTQTTPSPHFIHDHCHHHHDVVTTSSITTTTNGEDDVLAGCRALLSFSRGSLVA